MSHSSTIREILEITEALRQAQAELPFELLGAALFGSRVRPKNSHKIGFQVQASPLPINQRWTIPGIS